MRHDMCVSRSFQEFRLLLQKDPKDTLHEATIIFTSFSRVFSVLTDSVLSAMLEFPTASTLHC